VLALALAAALPLPGCWLVLALAERQALPAEEALLLRLELPAALELALLLPP
jgi:hypothetical protein